MIRYWSVHWYVHGKYFVSEKPHGNAIATNLENWILNLGKINFRTGKIQHRLWQKTHQNWHGTFLPSEGLLSFRGIVYALKDQLRSRTSPISTAKFERLGKRIKTLIKMHFKFKVKIWINEREKQSIWKAHQVRNSNTNSQVLERVFAITSLRLSTQKLKQLQSHTNTHTHKKTHPLIYIFIMAPVSCRL